MAKCFPSGIGFYGRFRETRKRALLHCCSEMKKPKRGVCSKSKIIIYHVFRQVQPNFQILKYRNHLMHELSKQALVSSGLMNQLRKNGEPLTRKQVRAASSLSFCFSHLVVS